MKKAITIFLLMITCYSPRAQKPPAPAIQDTTSVYCMIYASSLGVGHYKQFSISVDYGRSKSDRKKEEEPRYETIVQALNDLVRQGWEYVSDGALGQSNNIYIFLKRSKK